MDKSRCPKRPNPNPRSNPRRRCRRPFIVKHHRTDSGYAVDLRDLLFTRDRDFLIRNNGQKVSVDDLKGKTVVLFILPIDYHWCMEPGDSLDMTQAYHELLPLGGTEFVFVPVYIHDAYHRKVNNDCSARFDHLFPAIPFPAVPFSDVEACGDIVVNTFSITRGWPGVSYWVIIDPTSTVVATRAQFYYLFKHFGGAELYPLSLKRICTLLYEFELGDLCESEEFHNYCDKRRESRKRLIRKWDQLLASPARDFLISSNGDRVPISSLQGRLIGLYFCENIPCPPRMDVIKKAYRDAKMCGYDFEIVQINYHYVTLNARHTKVADFSEQQRYENISWLTLPFKDPSCMKLQRIFECRFGPDSRDWTGDCLVIVDSRLQTHQVVFEFCGAEIIEQYGIRGYPFTRQTLYEVEYTRHKKELKLQLLFPPGLCQFTRRRAGCNGYDLVNDSQLKGKRVLVLFSNFHWKDFPVMSMLKSKYEEQAEKDKFEIVYVSVDDCESEYIKDIPWLVHPYSQEFRKWCSSLIFKSDRVIGVAAAFDIDGQLISKGYLELVWGEMKHRFPFLSRDLRGSIKEEVQRSCNLHKYYREYY